MRVSAEQWRAELRGSGVKRLYRAGGCRAAQPPLLPTPSDSVDQAVETYGLQKITLLREISLKTGIQVGPHFQPGPQGMGTGAFLGW